MSTIDNLKGAISAGGGVARNNLWKVEFGRAGLSETQLLMAESVTLPGRTIATSDYTANKQSLKAAYSLIDDPVSMTFLLVNDYKVKTFFDKWMSEIINDEFVLEYKDKYQSTVTVTQLDDKTKGHSAIYTVELENAYPIIQNSYDLSNATENDITRLTVTFAYDKYNIK
jgi:hypothetical protein